MSAPYYKQLITTRSPSNNIKRGKSVERRQYNTDVSASELSSSSNTTDNPDCNNRVVRRRPTLYNDHPFSKRRSINTDKPKNVDQNTSKPKSSNKVYDNKFSPCSSITQPSNGSSCAWSRPRVNCNALPIYMSFEKANCERKITTSSYNRNIQTWSSRLYTQPYTFTTCECNNTPQANVIGGPFRNYISNSLKCTNQVHIHGLQEKQSLYWRNLFSGLCCKCLNQFVSVNLLCWKDDISFNNNAFRFKIRRRIERIPPTFQLFLLLRGLHPFNPIIRNNTAVTIQLEDNLVPLLNMFLNIDNSEALQINNEKVHIIYAEFIAMLVLSKIINNKEKLLKVIHYVLTKDIQPDNFLALFGLFLPTFTLNPESSSDLLYLAGLNPQIPLIQGRDLLLLILESFEICVELLNVPTAMLHIYKGIEEGSFLMTFNPNTQLCSLNSQNDPKDIMDDELYHLPSHVINNNYNIVPASLFFYTKTLPQNCLYPLDLQSPTLIALRFLVDRLKVLLCTPYSYKQGLRITSSFQIGSSTFDDLLQEASNLRQALEDFSMECMWLGPLEHGIQIVQNACKTSFCPWNTAELSLISSPKHVLNNTNNNQVQTPQEKVRIVTPELQRPSNSSIKRTSSNEEENHQFDKHFMTDFHIKFIKLQKPSSKYSLLPSDESVIDIDGIEKGDAPNRDNNFLYYDIKINKNTAINTRSANDQLNFFVDHCYSWIPHSSMQGFLFRGLTPLGVSSLVVQTETIIRRILAPSVAKENKNFCNVLLAILIDECTRAAQELGLASFPFLLSLLDLRSVLALLASPSTMQTQELQQHLRLILWWYGFLENLPPKSASKSPPVTLKSSLSPLLEEQLARAAYHFSGRRTAHHISKVIGPLISEEYRGLFVVANCGTWLAHAVPRLALPVCCNIWTTKDVETGMFSPLKLQEAWAFVTRYLRQSGFVAKCLSLDGGSGIAKLVETDVERSEKALQESSKVLLLLREMWDFTIVKDFESRCPPGKVFGLFLQRIETIQQTLNSDGNNKNRCLPKERFLQLMEMLRCLWTSPNSQSSDMGPQSYLAKAFLVDSIASKAYRSTDQFSALLPEDDSLASYGVTTRTQKLFRCVKGKMMEESCLSWRFCKVAQLYLTLLTRGIIYEDVDEEDTLGKNSVSPLEKHIALVVTILTSLAEVASQHAPIGMFRNWDLIIFNVSPVALYPFAPVILLKIIQLRNYILKFILEENKDSLHRTYTEVIPKILKPIDTTLIQLFESTRAVENEPVPFGSRYILSAFCEVFIRIPYKRKCLPADIPTPWDAEWVENPFRDSTNVNNFTEAEKTRICRQLFTKTGVVLLSDEVNTGSKVACLKALHLIYTYFNFNSILEFQIKSRATAAQTAAVIRSCLTMLTVHRHQEAFVVTKRILRRVGILLGLFGAPQPSLLGVSAMKTNSLDAPVSSNRHRNFPWWDSCSHFFALRAVEQLFYPNIHNRLSLFCCQELLNYLAAQENMQCSHHDKTGASLKLDDLFSEQTKSLSRSLKSFHYVISGVPHMSEDLLQKLCQELMESLNSADADVFKKCGLQFAAHSPNILRFLLPRLLLSTFSSSSVSSSSNSSDKKNHVAELTAQKIEYIFEEANKVITSGETNHNFLLFGPHRTCQVIFEALDMLQALLSVYLNADGQSLPTLQMQSKTDLHIRQCLSLSLSKASWTTFQTFLKLVTSRSAVSAASNCGSFSRSLYYLEIQFSIKPPGFEQLMGNNQSDKPSVYEFIEEYVNAYRGLQNWDNIRGCYHSLPVEHTAYTEKIALELQSQGQYKAAALEYLRFSKYVKDRQQDLVYKALKSYLRASAYGDFLLCYSSASMEVRAVALPLLQRVLWYTGYWTELETVTQLLERVWMNECKLTANTNYESLQQWNSSFIDKFDNNNSYANSNDTSMMTSPLLLNSVKDKIASSNLVDESSSISKHIITDRQTNIQPQIYFPSMEQILPSYKDLKRYVMLWDSSEVTNILSSGVVSALHQQKPELAIKRLNLSEKVALWSLASTAGESYARSYRQMVPLQLVADLRSIIDQGTSQFSAYLHRIDSSMPSSEVLWDLLTSFKLLMEELKVIPALLECTLRLSKLFRKFMQPKNFQDFFLPGQLQLFDLLTLAEKDENVTSAQLYTLRIELAKSLPLERQMEVLKPICDVDGKAAAMYASLNAAQHHLFSEKFFVLQKLTEQHPQSEKAHRILAELVDAQIHQILQKSVTSTKTSIRDFRKREVNEDFSKQTFQMPQLPQGWSFITLVEISIHHHLEAAAFSSSTRRVRDHLLHFLQMLVDIFFSDFSVKAIANKNPQMPFNETLTDIQESFVKNVCVLVHGKLERIPPAHWYLSVAQLVARSQHKELGPKVFQPLLARLMQWTPAQMAWQLGPLFCSERKDRREVAALILSAARNMRSCTGNDIKNTNAEKHVQGTATFASALISLASDSLSSNQQSNDFREKISIAQNFPQLLTILKPCSNRRSVRVLMPLLSQLDTAKDFLALHDENNTENDTTPWIVDVGDSVLVMRSKQRPKRLTLLGSDGIERYWLVKRESRGDLRKDTRLMEIAGYVNNWLEKLEKASQRQLQFCRYSVISLNEVTGLIEWLPNLTTLRAAVLDLWENEFGQTKLMALMKKVIARYNRFKGDPVALEENYIMLIRVFQPVLHKFFFNHFEDTIPLWYSCRKLFSESLASWSALGFILGLGDRHGENVLLNMKTGQIVHVDFDCLFGKGLYLPVPEIVPFRLTPNLVSTLGFGGLYGTYLSACVDTMTTLRQYRGDCLSILQSFVFDPSIEWTRSGKMTHNQVAEDDYVGGGARARQFISEIEEKINGGINFRSQRLLREHENQTLTLNEIYHHITTWVTEPGIDVESQVEELIWAATCHKNLSLMYVGWMPWL